MSYKDFLAQLLDSLDLARIELGIVNLSVEESSYGIRTFSFEVPDTFELTYSDDYDTTYDEENKARRSGVPRVCLNAVVDPTLRYPSDWLMVLYPGQVSFFPVGFLVLVFSWSSSPGSVAKL